MSSTVPFLSPSTLQASFAAGLSALTQLQAAQALTELRQVPAFSGLNTLPDLVSQDTIARLVYKPSLFQEAASRLSAFGDLEDLRAVSALPSIKERLKACAEILDLRHGVQIYGALLVFNDRPDELESIRRSMSRALGDRLNWPQKPTAEAFGDLAVSVRKTFNAYGEHLTAEQRHDLMQIAAQLNHAVGDGCGFNADQTDSPIQARKLGALVAALYGSGFGDDWTENVIDALRRLARSWGKLEVAERDARLRRLADEAKKLLEEVRSSYASLFDPIGANPSLRFNGAAAPLSEHLDALLPQP